MNKTRIPRGLGGGCRAKVLELLASSPPLGVAAIAKALRLSYMGVRSQCVKLERLGYLASSRKHRARGRPELVYRLTPKGRDLFPQGGAGLALEFLDHIARLAGPQFPEKVLFAYFQARAGDYAAALREQELPARALELAELRAAEGCFSRVENEGVLRIIESHSPLHRIFQKYPEAKKFETAAVGRALGVAVYREEGPAGETVFFLATPPPEPAAGRVPENPARPEPEPTPPPENIPAPSPPPNHPPTAEKIAPAHPTLPQQAELFAIGGE